MAFNRQWDPSWPLPSPVEGSETVDPIEGFAPKLQLQLGGGENPQDAQIGIFSCI